MFLTTRSICLQIKNTVSRLLLSDSPAANFPVLLYTQTEMKGEYNY